MIDVSTLDLTKYDKAFHHVSKMFPLDRKDLKNVCESVEESKGLRKGSEIQTLNGLVVEGRKRYIACDVLGFPHRFVELSETECAAAVARQLNFARTHYSEGERAQIGADLIIEERKHKDSSIRQIGVRVDQVGEQLKVSGDSIQNALKVETDGTPELKAAVKDGTVSVTKGAELAKLPPADQLAAIKKPDPIVKKAAKSRRKGILNATESHFQKLRRRYAELIVVCQKLVGKTKRSIARVPDHAEGTKHLNAFERCLAKMKKRKT